MAAAPERLLLFCSSQLKSTSVVHRQQLHQIHQLKPVTSSIHDGIPKTISIAEWCWAAGAALVWSLALSTISPTVFEGLDFVRFCEPVIQLFRGSILHGRLPWWNPYSSLGRPFAVDMQTAVFYPTTYLNLLFDTPTAWIIAATLHGTLAVLGFNQLMKWLNVSRVGGVVGGILFLFSAPLLARMQAGQVPYVYALCYLPLVVLFSWRLALNPSWKNWAALGLVWGLQLLCSHPQISWLSALASGAFVCGNLLQPPWGNSLRSLCKAGISIVAACACGTAMIAFVIVPFAELATQSNRAVPTLAFSSMFPMAPIHWLSLLTAQSSLVPINWEYNLHAGLPALIGGMIFLAQWRDQTVRGILLMIGSGLFIALGQTTPLFAVLYKILPGLSDFRIPARAGVLVVFGMIMATSLAAGKTARLTHGRSKAILAGAGLAAIIAVHFWWFMPRTAESIHWLLGRLIITAASIIGWSIWFGASVSRARLVTFLPLCVAFSAELVITLFNTKTYRAFPPNSIGEKIVVAAIHAHHLDQQVAPPRVSVSPAIMTENSGMTHRYATLSGFESLSLRRVWNYLHIAAGVSPDHAYNTSPAEEIYARAMEFNSLNLSVVLPEDSSVVSVIKTPDPRAYVATQATVVPNVATAISRMKTGHNFHENILVEEPWNRSVPAVSPAGVGRADISRFTLNSIDVLVESPASGILVLAEAWYPGWRAFINGQQTECFPVNAWMRGVAVPAGHSTVRLSYHQNGLSLGIAISAAAATLLAWAARTSARFPGASPAV